MFGVQCVICFFTLSVNHIDAVKSWPSSVKKAADAAFVRLVRYAHSSWLSGESSLFVRSALQWCSLRYWQVLLDLLRCLLGHGQLGCDLLLLLGVHVSFLRVARNSVYMSDGVHAILRF